MRVGKEGKREGREEEYKEARTRKTETFKNTISCIFLEHIT